MKKTSSESLKIGAAYIRVSTDGQMDLSPESQLDEILKYAKANHILLQKEFIFMETEGRSGKKADNRPQFQRMIATAKTKPKPFDCILVWKFSRFARNQDESTFYKGMLRKKLGIDVISITEPILEGMYGRLIEMIIEWQDEFYSYNLAQDVTRGMTKKAMNGDYQCRPPLGYRIPYHNATPEIVPEEAETIRFIFDQYVNANATLFSLARTLNQLGKKTSHGKSFEKRSLEYIIQNPAYCGRIRWNRTENSTHRMKDPDEWILRDGNHPAIISEELFDAANEKFSSTFRPRNAKPAEVTKHWLSGLLKCSSCGRTLSSSTRTTKHGTIRTFQCYGYCKGKCHHSHSVTDHIIEPAVLSALKEVIDSGTVSYTLKPTAQQQDFSQLKLLRDNLEKIKTKEERAKAAYMDGIDSLEEYKQNKKLLLAEQEQLIELISGMEKEQQETENPELLKAQMLRNIHNIYDVLISDDFSDIEKNLALKSIVEKIIFYRDTMHIEVFYYLPQPETRIK